MVEVVAAVAEVVVVAAAVEVVVAAAVRAAKVVVEVAVLQARLRRNRKFKLLPLTNKSIRKTNSVLTAMTMTMTTTTMRVAFSLLFRFLFQGSFEVAAANITFY